MPSEYEVIIADDPHHEKVFAEIHLRGKFIALISQEQGRHRLMVELPGPGLEETQVERRVPLTDFVIMLQAAAKKLVGKA